MTPTGPRRPRSPSTGPGTAQPRCSIAARSEPGAIAPAVRAATTKRCAAPAIRRPGDADRAELAANGTDDVAAYPGHQPSKVGLTQVRISHSDPRIPFECTSSAAGDSMHLTRCSLSTSHAKFLIWGNLIESYATDSLYSGHLARAGGSDAMAAFLVRRSSNYGLVS